MSEELRRALHDLSMEVSVVDLRDRALATSRRMTRRRRALTASVAVAVVAVVGGVTTALWPRGLDTTPPPPIESPTVSTSPSSSPTPTLALGDGLPGRVVVVGAVAPGVFGVVRFDGGQRNDYPFPGGGSTNEQCPWLSATISPDGRWLAYVTGSPLELPPTGDLYVAPVDGGSPRLVASDVFCGNNRHPIWLPDSATLRIARAVDNPLSDQPVAPVCGHINVNTGAFTSVTDGCGTIAFAPGGGLWARYPEVRDAQGGLVAQLPAAPVPVPRVVVHGISADGRLVAMGAGSTDPGVSRHVQWILDTATNEFLTVDDLFGSGVVPAGAELHGAVFLPDGGMVLGVDGPNGDLSWYLLDADRSVVAAHYNAPFPVSPGQFVYLP